jgi:glycolate oxidase
MVDTEALAAIVGREHVITDPLELRTYECDGLTSHRSVPALVVLPATAEQTAQIVRHCAATGTPFVARGSGTGLSGGALPHPSGVLIVMSRMRRILSVDPVSRRAIVEPGVTNLSVSNAVRQYGLFYAPDPSSQVICSVGGNVAENSGGAHCLKYGFTVHHVTGIEIVTPDGELTWIGDGTGVTAGYDLLGAFTGSEGTLGIVTKIAVKLTPLPETIHTLLAAYDSMADGGRAVSDIIAAGITPAAIEMMDPLAMEAAEAAVQPGYPAGAGAVLIVELDGPAAEVEAELLVVRRILASAIEIRAADDPEQRARIWAGRKSAFAAVGRLAPSFIVQDGVVPRTALGDVLARIGELSAEHGIRVANVFHAGDGNLHPLVLYDDSSPSQTEAAEVLSGAILDACIEHGGSITGEHGVGVDKSRYMPKMFTDADLDTMQLVRCAFDPRSLCNPGKIFPTPRLCGEMPRTIPPGVDIFLWTLRRSPIQPVPPTRSRGSSPPGSPAPRRPRRSRRYCAPPPVWASRSCRVAWGLAWTGAVRRRAATWCSTCPGWTRSSSTRPVT